MKSSEFFFIVALLLSIRAQIETTKAWKLVDQISSVICFLIALAFIKIS